MPSQVHQLRSLLTVVIGGIQTDNPDMALSAARRMVAQLEVCQCCPLFSREDTEDTVQ
jgi:hypothetical protein